MSIPRWLLPCAAALVLLLPATSWSEVYKWVDKNGTTHFTDDPDQLPEPMRSRALEKLRKKMEKKQEEKQRRRDELPRETLPSSPERDTLPSAHRRENTGSSSRPARRPSSGTKGTRTKLSKKLWTQRVEQARQRVENLEAQCDKLQSEKNSSGRNALIYARPGDRKKAAESRTALEQCREKLEKARHYLKVDLPEKARRAGVPPGWLR